MVAETVAAPLEQKVNGVEGMLYMSSQATTDGAMTLTVTFRLGTDPDNPDTDGDGLSDGDEVHTYDTDPTAADSDGVDWPALKQDLAAVCAAYLHHPPVDTAA